MIEDVISNLNEAIESARVALGRELGKLRTGRAHPGMLDSIRVDYYGQVTPIGQMASVGVPEPRQLTVKPWDKGMVKAVEKALRESDLGINPQVDGDLIRVPIPALSEERRKDLVRVAKKQGEECKIAVRKARHDAIDLLEVLEKDGDVSEDEAARGKKRVEDIVLKAGQAVDAVIQGKEHDILAV